MGGCYGGRNNNDGKPEYSKEKHTEILKALEDKKEITEYFKNGFRLHHTYGDEKTPSYYLTYARSKGHEAIFKSNVFTVSEAALLATADGQTNYAYIFSNLDYLKALQKNYAEHGFKVENKDLISAFEAQETLNASVTDNLKVFTELRHAFLMKDRVVPEKPKETPTTGPVKDAAPKDAAPKDAAPKDAAPKDAAPKDSAPKDSAPKDSAPKDSAPSNKADSNKESVNDEQAQEKIPETAHVEPPVENPKP